LSDIPTMVLTKPDNGVAIGNHNHGTLKQLVEKMNLSSLPPTPDATPNATPNVTPACSPQIARRAGNPFFSGTPAQATNNSSSGSWLFRSSSSSTNNKGERLSEDHNYLYEAKPEFQRPLVAGAGPANGSKQKVRYVPRPSELRELNFWSPTSM